ncbi:MAG: thrombospondin type 3 repeat-containing protein, partial [Woeseia sp.]
GLGSRLAVLAAGATDGAILEVRDAIDGQLVSSTPLAGTAPVDLTTLGASKLALLLADPVSGVLRVDQRNALGTSAAAPREFLGAGFAPRAVVSGHGGSVGTLGTDAAGIATLSMRDAVSGAGVGTLATQDVVLLHSYFFNGDLSDSTGTLALVGNGGQIVDGRYVFAPNQGLTLNGGLSRTDQYTVEMAFTLDATTPFYKKLIDLDGLAADTGLYVAGDFLRFYPSFSVGGDVVDPGTQRVLIMTVDGAITSVYLDGALQFAVNDVSGVPPANILNFFIDDLATGQTEAVSGSVDYLQIYDGVLPGTSVATLAPPTQGDADGDGVLDISDNCKLIANPAQIDSNGDGYGNACDQDLNNDCVVNAIDLGLLRSVFFTADPDADFNNDGVVNVVDLGALRQAFFTVPGPSSDTAVCAP